MASKAFTIVKGSRPSNVTQKDLDKMNKKYGGWWPKVMHVKKRSSVKPVTKADKQLSIKHLKHSLEFNKKHIKDHTEALKNGGSKKYNKDHIKHHKKQMKEDSKLIKERQKMKPKQRSAKRLSPAKAKMMLKDNSAQGHKLTSKQKKLFQAVAHGFKPTKQRKTISIPKKELVEEHKELVKTLKSGSKQKLHQEAKKQAKELKGYKKERSATSYISGAVKGLKAATNQVAKNVQEGQANFKSGKSPYYARINPLKGTGDAFMQGFKAKRKLQRAMQGHKR